MQGALLSVAAPNSQGLILGDDGVHYTYALADWRNPVLSASPGMKVDFEVSGSQAVGVYPLPEAAPPPTAQQPPTAPVAGAASPVPPPQPAATSPNASFAPPSQPASSTQAGELHPLINLYFNPSGRINRSTFWLKGILLLGLIWVAIYAITTLLTYRLNDLPLTMYMEAVAAEGPAFVPRLVVANFSPIPNIYEFVKFNVEIAGILSQLTSGSLTGVLILWISSLIHMWIGFAVVAKRLHDTDRTGWWMLAWVGGYAVGMLTTPFYIGWFILLALFIWILVWLGFQEGTPNRNRYDKPQQTTGGTHSAGQPSVVPRPVAPPSPHWMFPLSALLSVISAGLVIVAAFLPWVTVYAFFGGDASGIEGGTA